MNDHVRIFKSWTESGTDPHATWVIERQDAKCLFEQLEAALDSTMHQENYDAACLRADEAEEERDRLKEQLETLRGALERIAEHPSEVTTFRGRVNAVKAMRDIARDALNPASEPKEA